MMKEIQFWVTLTLLVLAVGFITCRQFCMKDASLQEIPGVRQNTAPGTTAGSVLPTEMTSAAMMIRTEETQTETPGTDRSDADPVHDGTMPWLPAEKIAEIRSRLDVLSDLSEDLTGWLYLADTDIDFPVVKGEDNQFYLSHAPDRKPNRMGTIFLDRQCSRDFSGKRNILYGHNFQRGMFGTLRTFKKRQIYDAHPYGWLLTADCIYRIEFFALVIVHADDPVYLTPADSAAWQNAIAEHSLYCTGDMPEPEEQCIALSTCASDFEDARELLIGRMIDLTDTEALADCQEAD